MVGGVKEKGMGVEGKRWEGWRCGGEGGGGEGTGGEGGAEVKEEKKVEVEMVEEVKKGGRWWGR